MTKLQNNTKINQTVSKSLSTMAYQRVVWRRWLLAVAVAVAVSVVKPSGLQAQELDATALRDEVAEMFEHGFQSYLSAAFPSDELQPLSCGGQSSFFANSVSEQQQQDAAAAWSSITSNATTAADIVSRVVAFQATQQQQQQQARHQQQHSVRRSKHKLPPVHGLMLTLVDALDTLALFGKVAHCLLP